ncbi:50S ribosomal protein L31 [Candidatus Marinamargulisbacteria bacterium SCGC AAA071-K20]|nr:50S ribosomal protein L31 [Candidatus Marinamargulisbacteria bacterium SCGC AAA071-K20]
MAKTKDKKEKKKKGLYTREDTVPYKSLVISCVCGSEFDSGSTLEEIRVDICSNCHPFFTGEDRILDAEGRVEKFRKKYQQASKKK